MGKNVFSHYHVENKEKTLSIQKKRKEEG